MNYGRYQVVDKIGEGSSGVLFQAYDPQIDRMVALKVLREERVTSEEFVNRFIKEAKAIGRLSHPNIVTVYDVGQDRGTIYIAMEFLTGRPLDRVIKEGLPTLRETVQIGLQIAEALDYAHRQGIVHRDIKPPNIILSSQGQAKITDFGIAHIEDPDAAQLTQDGVVMGTPLYMSPEQVAGRPVDGRSDIYSLGAILYELMEGRPPFKESSLVALFGAISQNPPVSPKRIDDSLAPARVNDLRGVILKCLVKTPEGRFQAGEDLRLALAGCLREEVSAVREGKPDRVRRLILGGALAAVIAGFAAGGAYFWPEKKQSLSVGSTPAGARVFIDGTFLGETPLQLELLVGKHEVRMSLVDYYDWEAQVQLGSEKAESISIPLVPVTVEGTQIDGEAR